MTVTTERDTRRTMSFRAWGATRATLETLGKAEKFAYTTLIGDTAEVLAGAIHCARCGETVPAVMGDCTGKPLRAWVAAATAAVYRQKCRDHQPVSVGVQTPREPLAAPGPRDEPLAGEEPAQGRTEPPATVAGRLREAAREAGHDVVTASELPSVPPGSIRFVPIDDEPNLPPPVLAPEVPVGRAKKGRAQTAACPHRVRPGAWCKTCQAVIKQ